MYLSTPRGTVRQIPGRSLGDSSLGAQGLFGSQTRPGMRSRRPKLGSLSGSSLGDDTAQTADVFPDAAGIAAASAAQATAQREATLKKVAIGGGIALAAYLLFFRKRGSTTVAVP